MKTLKKSVKTVAKSKIVAPIVKYKYTTSIDHPSKFLDSYYNDDDDEYADVTETHGAYAGTLQQNNRKAFTFSFQVQQVPFCCGLAEAGNFTYDNHISDVPEEEKVKLVKELFSQLYANSLGENNEKIQIIFTLIRGAICDFIRKALIDSKKFTLIKSFINRNSAVTNDLYVSV